MSYTERFDKLYEDLRLVVRNKVKEIGQPIETEGYVDLVTRGGVEISTVGEDVIYNKDGYEFSYSELDVEDFCMLADYVQTL